MTLVRILVRIFSTGTHTQEQHQTSPSLPRRRLQTSLFCVANPTPLCAPARLLQFFPTRPAVLP